MNGKPRKKERTIDISTDIERFARIGVLGILLADRSTGGNIIWASNVYSDKGESYAPEDEIYVTDVTRDNAGIIRARATKSRDDQVALTRAHAEVFTPLWVVRKMMDWADEAWYEAHPQNSSLWQEYVRSPRLEITCGEAPYLVTRYDTVTGSRIPVYRRCGVLDRKLAQIIEHVRSRRSWLNHATAALQSTYGYEYQGDNLLIARVNVLATLEDFCDTAGWDSFTPDEYRRLAEIISWNLWQMDGLKDCVPNGALGVEEAELRLPSFNELTGISSGQMEIGIARGRGAAKIFDWNERQEVEFQTLKREVTLMDNGPHIKFDYIIGNPPYQEEQEGDNTTFSPPIYHLFMDCSREVSDVVELIHPGRFLFNAGSTPKAWNKKMLNDEHFTVLMYEQDCTRIFPNTDIKGGIAISLCDAKRTFEPIKIFTAFPELNDILHRVPVTDASSLASIVYIQNRFNLDALFADYPKVKPVIGSNGKDKRFEKNIFLKVGTDVFSESEIPDTIHVLGILNNKRTWRYIQMKYVDMEHENINAWKVLIPTSNGSGKLGEPLSHPLVVGPYIGYTRSFIGIGAFDNEDEANAALKYIKSKFSRTLLGALKITQDNNRVVWRMIPLQDFTDSSDIDWSQSVSDIDQQLYAKYGLTDDEIEFIETHVKEMQ